MRFEPRIRFVSSNPRAFSLTELLVVIAVIGILAMIAIPNIVGVTQGSEYEVAKRNLNLLNAAYNGFAMANRNLSGGSTAEVLSYLKFRDPSVPGSPFIPQTMNIVITSSDQTYRGSWTGYSFKLLPKASTGSTNSVGTGVDLLKISENVAAESGTALPAP